MNVTISEWGLLLYYGFIIATILMVLYRVIFLNKRAELFVILLLFVVYGMLLLNCIGRPDTMNEWQYIILAWEQESLWVKMVFLGYLGIIAWWIVAICHEIKKLKQK